MNDTEYLDALRQRQTELVHFQQWVRDTQQKVLIILEGRDGSGKTSLIRDFTRYLNPRACRVVALDKPSIKEQSQWYFQRYIEHLPSAGEIVIFDRSWYNRAGVESVMGFCSQEQVELFLRSAPLLEQNLTQEGMHIHKYFLSINAEEQAKRFRKRLTNARKRWKYSPMDEVCRERWNDYSDAYSRMFATTHHKAAPWTVIESDSKKRTRLALIDHLLSQHQYPDHPLPSGIEVAELASENCRSVEFGPAEVIKPRADNH